MKLLKVEEEGLVNEEEDREEGGDRVIQPELEDISEEENEDDDLSSEESVRGPEDKLEAGVFDPPLYRQRYEAVFDIINDEKWNKGLTKIVDFGCSYWKFGRYLRRLEFAQEVIGVDVDEFALESSFRLNEPIFNDYIETRSHCQLDLHLFKGGIHEKDERMKNSDVVVAIELIEHLHPEELKKVPATVFGFICPKVAIFTTPNEEFNVLFPDFEGPFRHWDHKFEWNRAQFAEWCEEILNEFGDYEVHLSGIGLGPRGTESEIGFCSQMATFVRKDFSEAVRNGDVITGAPESCRKSALEFNEEESPDTLPYRRIGSHKFIHRSDDRSLERKVFDEVMFYARQCAFESDEWKSEQTARIDLDFVLNFPKVADLNVDRDFVRNVLVQNNVDVEYTSSSNLIILFPPEVWPSDSEEEENENQEVIPISNPPQNYESEEEGWDS